MKRRHQLLCGSAGLLLVLLLAYSSVGMMTGVYACPRMGYLDGSHAYLVRRGTDWYVMNIRGNGGDNVKQLQPELVEVRAGWWTATIVLRADGTRIGAFTPWNLLDVADLAFGGRSALGR